MKNLEINGNIYENISKIAVPISGGGMAQFQDVDESGGDAEVVTGTFTVDSDKTSSEYTIDHNCGWAPDIIMITTDYESYIEGGGTLPTNGTLVYLGYFAPVKAKLLFYYSTHLNGPISASIDSENDGHIREVTSTSFKIKLISSRRLSSNLTYTYTCIKL